MRYFVEVLRADGSYVQTGSGGMTTADSAIRLIDEQGARDTTYWVIEKSKDAYTREVVAAGKPHHMVRRPAYKPRTGPADDTPIVITREDLLEACGYNIPSPSPSPPPPYFADPETERSFCDFTPPQPVAYVPKFHVEKWYPDGWRDCFPLRRFDARLDAVREVYVSYAKIGRYRILESTPSGRHECVGLMDFRGPATKQPAAYFADYAAATAHIYEPGDKVRVTYETEVIPSRSRFNRSADNTPLVAVRRPGSRSGPTTVPINNVELVTKAMPEWWPPRVGDVVAYEGWGRGIVVNPPADHGAPEACFAVFLPNRNLPYGSTQTFGLASVEPMKWILVSRNMEGPLNA